MTRSAQSALTHRRLSSTTRARRGTIRRLHDLLSLDGEDLRELPLVERKRRLKAVMPAIESRLLYVDHLVGRGKALFEAACDRDLQGIVAKWSRGSYHSDGGNTSWLKIKNPDYSHMAGRRELFEARYAAAPQAGVARAGAGVALRNSRPDARAHAPCSAPVSDFTTSLLVFAPR